MKIEQVLADIRDEPPWRAVASRECAYYDCNQLDSDVVRAMEDMGMLPMQRPLIPAAIDVVLGLEARQRRDYQVVADEAKDSDEARALSVRMHEAERLSRLDRAVSDAYEGQVKTGVGWVDVGTNPDPFGYVHRCTAPHRRELWWDWRQGAEQDEWRYLVRRRWFDTDRLAPMFPGKERLIEAVGKQYPEWSSPGSAAIGYERDDAEELWRAGLVSLERNSAIEEAEWRDAERRRACLFEVWYREWKKAPLLRVLESDMLLVFDANSPRHRAMVDAGMAEIESRVFPQVRLAYYLGPHRLADVPSPYQHGRFPYVLFSGLQEDRTGMFYGLIRRMMSTQDEINAVRTKMNHLMSSTLVIGDEDAFTEDADGVADRIGQKNSVVFTNPDRKNRGDKPEIRVDRELSAQHFGALQEAQRILPELAGIYQALMGKEQPQQSGVAIAALVEQGATGLAALNANYEDSRRRCGHLLLANEVQRMSGRSFEVMIEKNRRKVSVAFNRQLPDENGRTNDLMLLATRVELADAPQTATYRQQLLAGLMSLIESMPDAMKGAIVPMVIRGTDYPDREEVAQLLEQQMGIGTEPDPAAKLNEQRTIALQQRMQEIEISAQDAKARQGSANADKLEVEVERLRLEVQNLLQQMQQREEDRAMQAAMNEGLIVAPPNALPIVPSGA